MSNYQEKYKKALKSIEEIIKANKQIKDELDALRMMRQNDVDSFANIQKEEFKKAYDALLKEKNSLYIANQTLELQNEKLKYTISELEGQVALYKNDRYQKNNEDRLTLQSNQLAEGLASEQGSPKRAEGKDWNLVIREKEAEFHRAIENYEEHHANLQRNNKRLEERIAELENKLMNSEKNWRIKYEAKELEVIDIKALTRQEFTDQISLLRKENSAMKIANNDLALKLENIEKNAQFNKNLQNYDWEADLVQEMINVKANLEPLRQQINELQEFNIYEKEQSVRDRTNLQTRVMELEAEIERNNETIKGLEKKVLEGHQERSGFEDKAQLLKKYQEENQLLNGRIIVMESREIALRNRTGQQLQERVLEFQNRIELLLNNKEGLRELREVGIHQLLALKAYIMELDSKLKELLLSNNYLLKKYKSYKEKYQASLKEHKQYSMTINTLKMKILGYDKLVVKLQGELQRIVRTNQTEYVTVSHKTIDESNQSQIYKKKYQLMKEKLEIQQKYKEQEMETFKLDYETRIMELTIKVEEMRSLRETIDLYRNKNQELQGLLSKKQTELFESKILTSSKVNQSENEPMSNTRQTKDIINNLHINLKHNDETIFRLQTQLRNKQDTYKRTISKLEREISDLREDHARQLSKKEMDFNITLDQEVKKYKLKISDLEHTHHLTTINHKDEHSKKYEEGESKIRKLETRLQEAEAKREEEVFNRRRLEKQILDLNHDKEEIQRSNNDLQLKITHYKVIERELEQLKNKTTSTKLESKDSYLDYQLQSKDTIIKKLNNEIFELKAALGGLGERDITISSQKNEVYYLKKEIAELNDTINKYNNEITLLKSALDNNKSSFNIEFSNILEEKEAALGRLRRDLSAKQNKIHEFEEEVSRLEESIRKYKRDLTEMERLKQEIQRLQSVIQDKDKYIEKWKYQESHYEQQIERISTELTYVKQNYQKLSYQLLEKNDEVSKLNLELNSVGLKNKESIEGRYMEELLQKEKQYNKLQSEYLTLKNTITMIEEDKTYHEDNYKRANNETFNMRAQINQLQEENEDINNQLYYKTQEISKLQYSIEGYKSEIQEYNQKTEQIYRMRTEIFSLKSDISNLQEEIFSKEAANARLSNEINYVRSQMAEMEEELDNKQNYLNKLNYEYNSVKGGQEEFQIILDERQKANLKLNTELNSLRNKYRDLQEEMEEREQAFSLLNQELGKVKVNLGFYEQEIEERNMQIAKINNEKQLIKAEIVRLNDTITEKNQELNKAKQELFTIKLQAGQRDYAEKMRIDQQIYSFRNKITMLEHQVEDKDSEIRRLYIELDSVKHQPSAEPYISEEEMQQLRNQLGKKQRELINNRFDLEDRQYQLETMTNNANMLKTTLDEYQQRLNDEREQYESAIREASQRERRLQQEITSLQEELERREYQLNAPKTYSFNTNSYSQEDMREIRDKYEAKERELSSLKYDLQDKLYVLESLDSKTKMQEKLLQQIQEQYNEDRQRYENQLQTYITKERQYTKTITEMQFHYEQQISDIQLQKTSNYTIQPLVTPSPSPAPAYPDHDQNTIIQPYIRQIDRLNNLVSQLTSDIQTFKLKLSSMINQQSRIEQNLVTMVLLFSQVQSLRERIRAKEAEIGEVRKSFIQMAVSGEIEANKMSRLMGMVKGNNLNSEEQIQSESVDKQSVQVFQQIDEAQEHLENSKPQPVVERREEVVVVEGERREEIASPVEVVESKKVVTNEIKGSLIQQLQREDFAEGSQVRGGQITIKIQNPGQFVTSNVSPQPVYQQLPPQPQYIQGPNGQVRVIQQTQQVQHFIVPHNAPYPGQQILIQNSPTHSGVLQPGAIPPHMRGVPFYQVATPAPYRSLP